MKKIKIWNVDHAIEIIEFYNMFDRFHLEFGELKPLIYDDEGNGEVYETLGVFLVRNEITLEQLVDFLNRNRDNPNEHYYIYDHWIERLIHEFGFETRYKLEQLGGPRQNTTKNWIDRGTLFKNIPVESVDKIVLAITNLTPEYNYNEVLIKLFDEYLER